MPWKKKGPYRKKRSNYRRRPNFKRSIMSTVNKMAETKYYTNTLTNTEITGFNTSSSVVSNLIELSTISAGDNHNNRDGYKVFFKWLTMRMQTQTYYSKHLMRVLIVKSLHGPLSASDFPTTITERLGNHMYKHKVLRDKVYTLHSNAENGYISKYLPINVKLNSGCYWDSTSGTSDVRGGIYVMFINDTGAGSGTPQEITVDYGLSYKDI